MFHTFFRGYSSLSSFFLPLFVSFFYPCFLLPRAPVLVAVALVEAGMEPLDAIDYIRKRRRGAINSKQLKYLQNYRRRGSGGGCGCVIL